MKSAQNISLEAERTTKLAWTRVKKMYEALDYLSQLVYRINNRFDISGTLQRQGPVTLFIFGPLRVKNIGQEKCGEKTEIKIFPHVYSKTAEQVNRKLGVRLYFNSHFYGNVFYVGYCSSPFIYIYKIFYRESVPILF